MKIVKWKKITWGATDTPTEGQTQVNPDWAPKTIAHRLLNKQGLGGERLPAATVYFIAGQKGEVFRFGEDHWEGEDHPPLFIIHDPDPCPYPPPEEVHDQEESLFTKLNATLPEKPTVEKRSRVYWTEHAEAYAGLDWFYSLDLEKGWTPVRSASRQDALQRIRSLHPDQPVYVAAKGETLEVRVRKCDVASSIVELIEKQLSDEIYNEGKPFLGFLSPANARLLNAIVTGFLVDNIHVYQGHELLNVTCYPPKPAEPETQAEPDTRAEPTKVTTVERITGTHPMAVVSVLTANGVPFTFEPHPFGNSAFYIKPEYADLFDSMGFMLPNPEEDDDQ